MVNYCSSNNSVVYFCRIGKPWFRVSISTEIQNSVIRATVINRFLPTGFKLIFGISTPLQTTGWNVWKAFQMAKLGGKNKKIVDLVANRGSLEGNYCGRILIPGSYLRRGTEVAWGEADTLRDAHRDLNPWSYRGSTEGTRVWWSLLLFSSSEIGRARE